MINHFSEQLRLWLGIEKNQTSHSEKLISALGALLGISATVWVSFYLVDSNVLTVHSSLLVIASLGATSVLIFAVPHGALSQPWQVLGGHMVSGIIGVSCQKYLGIDAWSAGIAVGLAVGAMYYLRCIHPPGGATALTAVMGGQDIIQLGYGYLLYPLLLNLVVILAVAISFNYLFRWRQYPVYLNTRKQLKDDSQVSDNEVYALTTEDFNAAIREHNSFVDVTEDGLSELLELAKQHAMAHAEHPANIIPGRYYSNGRLGRLWSVRHVIDANTQARGNDIIIYKTVAGFGAYATDKSERETFRQWARFEVVEHNGVWVKAGVVSKDQVVK